MLSFSFSFFSHHFLQSGYDKIKDWKGNVEWLTGHFHEYDFGKTSSVCFRIVLVLEVVSGILCVSWNYPTRSAQDVVIRGLGFLWCYFVLYDVGLYSVAFSQKITMKRTIC